jgi:uncharacterized repeat protein (TIGR03803 family)
MRANGKKMSAQKWLAGCGALLLAVLAAELGASAQGLPYKVIHEYSGASTGGLILDSKGNLYGVDEGGKTTSGVCGYGCGTVFELSPQAGQWKKTTLYEFTGGNDGKDPSGPLAFDKAGNLYGTTGDGGAYGNGVVFELSPAAGGGWTESVLYAFTGVPDGVSPFNGVTLDAAGNIYGTTFQGGIESGVVFELTPQAGGGWNESVLYTFGYGTDGGYPQGSLIFDTAGNLYGTTTSGGDRNCGEVDGCGVVFELKANASGGWLYNVIFTFNGVNGGSPSGQMVFDASGNLYGATAVGGQLSACDGSGCGVVFELSPGAGGGWSESVLFVFRVAGGGYDGPAGTLINGIARDSAGNLYGTAYSGGTGGSDGNGLVFKLSRGLGGSWRETVLYDFVGGSAGGSPLTGVTLDAAGNVFGTTRFGGALSKCTANNFGLGCGVTFEIKQ